MQVILQGNGFALPLNMRCGAAVITSLQESCSRVHGRRSTGDGMFMKRKLALFSRSRALEAEIEEFLQNLSQSALTYQSAISAYLSNGANAEFQGMVQQLGAFESRDDSLRRSIEAALYRQTLIPESRGDVLGLLETLDQVHGLMEGGLYALSIEKPDIPEPFVPHFRTLAAACVQGVDHLVLVVLAARAFFTNIDAVPDHLHKVMYYEKEADKAGTILKRAIFDSDLDLSRKMHLKSFAEYIDDVADGAEDVADRLGIYTIKRAI
jgi:predicted phosphate transport protein (TIGR00153 family)